MSCPFLEKSLTCLALAAAACGSQGARPHSVAPAAARCAGACGSPAARAASPGSVQVGPGDVAGKPGLAALLAAHPAGTHFLFAPGVYEMGGGAPIMLGEAQSGMVLDAMDPAHPPVFRGDPAMSGMDGSGFLALRAGTTLRGFTIRNLVIRDFDLALVFDGAAEDVTIESSVLENYGERGIVLAGCRRCTVRSNRLHSDQPQSGHADAIITDDVDLLVVADNVVSSPAVGLTATGATRALVVDNTFIRREAGGPGKRQIGIVFGVSERTAFVSGSDCDTSGKRGFVGAIVDNVITAPADPALAPGWVCLALVGPEEMQLLATGNTCNNFMGSFDMGLQAHHVVIAGNHSHGAAIADVFFGEGSNLLDPTGCGSAVDNIALAAADDVVGGGPSAHGNLLVTEDELGAQRDRVEADLRAIHEAAHGDTGAAGTAEALHELYRRLGRSLCDAARAPGRALPEACDAFR